MTIHLSEDLRRFVHDAVVSGLYAREDDVIRDALNRLRQSMPSETQIRDSKQGPVMPEELLRRLFAAGLMTRLPDPSADIDDDDPPVEISGEPLSETIIRERR